VAAALVDLAAAVVAVAVQVVVGNFSNIFMKYFLIIAVVFSQIFSAMAQQMKLPVGKKYTITTSSSNLVEVTMMDNHTQMSSDVILTMYLEISAIKSNGYSMQLTPIHMQMGFNMNGMEQKMDTDSSSTKSNPEYAKLYEFIDHPQLIEVADNKVIKNSLQSKFNPTGVQDDYGKYFLDISNVNLHNGYSWTDSSANESGKTVNQYIVLQITDSTVLIHVNSDYELHSTVEQAGTKIVQKLKGFSTAKRNYWRQNGLLQEEKMELDFSGSTETNELTAPITLKLKSTTLVQ
jgi:hypothetical protein